jgi:hypothetical protein
LGAIACALYPCGHATGKNQTGGLFALAAIGFWQQFEDLGITIRSENGSAKAFE